MSTATHGTGIPRLNSIKGQSIANLNANTHATAPSRPIHTKFSKSVGGGMRAAPQPPRAPTSMGFSRSTSTRSRANTRTSRPQTAVGYHDAEEEVIEISQHKGTSLLASFSQQPPPSLLPRRKGNAPSLCIQERRSISGLSKQFANLSFHSHFEDQAVSGQARSSSSAS